MLEIVSKGFKAAKNALTGRTTLTEANIDDALREIRVSLLEADVEFGVVRSFLSRVKQRALGEVVQTEVKTGNKKVTASPGEHFTLICQNELEKLMGPVEETPIVFRRPYTILMMVGLQGTGKTTTCGKLASWLIAQKRKPLLVAADVYRPAAVEQLQILGQQLGVPVYAQPGLAPAQLCLDALREAKRKKRDIVIFDTAGRLAINDEMMNELEDIKKQTKPDNIFLVADAMAGQDTVRTASEFNRRLDITGFIMTKLDGDARGGAALSIKEISGKPIKFLGLGEGLDKLEPFRPEGLASRILGMGDIVGLMKDFEAVVDEKQAERDARKLLRGTFTLDDFLKQLSMIKKVGSIKDIYEKFPIFGDSVPAGVDLDDKTFMVLESLIHSMTVNERNQPEIIDKSRAERIAKGSGRRPEQVFELLQRFFMMQTMMQNIAAAPGLLGSLPGFKQLSALRKLKGKGMDDLMGALGGGGSMPMGLPSLPKGMPGLRSMPMAGGASGLPGLPNMNNLGAMGADDIAGDGMALPGGMQLPPGINPEQYAAMMNQRRPTGPRPLSTKEREKQKAKRKAEKKARKKSRRH
ncbi:MAG: signal recognition particle protein [Deltaproteobacteria bacterium]|nr:signal recognition particle protein [Deltaproteobacteria bacterium]